MHSVLEGFVEFLWFYSYNIFFYLANSPEKVNLVYNFHY